MPASPNPASPEPDALLREVADRLALRALVEAYARGADRRDRALVAAQFMPEGRLVIDRGDGPPTVLEGRERIEPAMKRLERYEATTHFLGQQTLHIDGDEATGETYCMAHHLSRDDQGRVDRVMAIRYLDRYRRTESGWLIDERHLVLDWSEVRRLGELEEPAATT